jgi:hypothetical protein
LACRKETTLQTIPYPELLNDEIRIAKVFPSGVVFFAGPNGFYIDFIDREDVSIPITDFDFNANQTASMQFHLTADNTILGLNDQYLLIIKNSQFEYQRLNYLTNAVNFNQVLSPSGQLFRTDYWNTSDALSSGKYLIRVSIYENEEWRVYKTNMGVPVQNFDLPSIAFDSDGDAYITTNPIFHLTDVEGDTLAFEKLKYSTTENGVKSIAKPQIVDQTIYGFDKTEGPNRDYRFNFNTGQFKSRNLADNSCLVGNSIPKITNILSFENQSSACWISTFELNYINNDEFLGALMIYDHMSGRCQTQTIPYNGGYPGSSNINSVDFNWTSNQLIFGTNQGAYFYDFNSNNLSPYITKVFDLNEL